MYAIYGADTATLTLDNNLNSSDSGGDRSGRREAGGECIASSKPYGVIQ